MITGLVVVRNAISLDYCVQEAALSLVPYCDTVVISDMESDDGTWEMLEKWKTIDSRIKLERQPWANPHNRPTWWVEALNYARTNFVPQDGYILQLDADEVISEHAHTGIRLCIEAGSGGLFKRWNFWQDPQHMTPENRCCGTMVARFGKANLYLPSDEPHPVVTPNLRTTAEYHGGMEIYHYGFLRKPQAFVRKSEVVQNAFFGSCDSRILEYKDKPMHWNSRDYFDGLPLRDFINAHPKVARKWLEDRGYKLS